MPKDRLEWRTLLRELVVVAAPVAGVLEVGGTVGGLVPVAVELSMVVVAAVMSAMDVERDSYSRSEEWRRGRRCRGRRREKGLLCVLASGCGSILSGPPSVPSHPSPVCFLLRTFIAAVPSAHPYPISLCE